MATNYNHVLFDVKTCITYKKFVNFQANLQNSDNNNGNLYSADIRHVVALMALPI